MDIFNQVGELALGSRLRRLSDHIMREGVSIYKNYQIAFDPKWFPVYYALSQRDGIAIMELAAMLNMSHPGIIKIAKELEKAGYIISEKDREDGRKRLLSLSGKGKALLPSIKYVWEDIAEAIALVLNENEVHLLKAIAQTERSLIGKSFSARVRESKNARLLQAVEIVDYEPALGTYFKAMNYDWIEQYFVVEPIDTKVLENHQKEIIDKGGYICFARLDGVIVGTCALKKVEEGLYELTKMAVSEAARGKQAGKKLGLAIIDKAKSLGAHTLYLESNRILTTAINLYHRLGFVETPHDSHGASDYSRSDIRMEIRF